MQIFLYFFENIKKRTPEKRVLISIKIKGN